MREDHQSPAGFGNGWAGPSGSPAGTSDDLIWIKCRASLSCSAHEEGTCRDSSWLWWRENLSSVLTHTTSRYARRGLIWISGKEFYTGRGKHAGQGGGGMTMTGSVRKSCRYGTK